jgi:hypothetical protein
MSICATRLYSSREGSHQGAAGLDDSAGRESPTERLKALFTGRLRRYEERRFARRVCDEALAALEAVREQQPALSGPALYEAVIARRLRVDAAAAHSVMRRVEASRDDWESDRAPKFIDVVNYLIVSEYLAREPGASGMTLDLGPVLAERIDPRL